MYLRRNLIVDGMPGRVYCVGRPYISSSRLPLRPIDIRDPDTARSLVRDLDIDEDQWLHIHEVDYSPGEHLSRPRLHDFVAAVIARGAIPIYPVTHLRFAGQSVRFVPLKNGRDSIYYVAPATALLVENPRIVHSFYRQPEAASAFVAKLNLSESQLRDIAASVVLPFPKRIVSREDLIRYLDEGEVVVVEVIPTPAIKEKAADFLPTTGPGFRPATLGPHDGASPNPPATGPTTGEQVASTALDVTPVVGSLKSAGQVITGTDLVTGEPVNRALEAAGIVAGIVPGGKAALKALSKAAAWGRYQARGGKLSKEQWDKKYDTLMANKAKGADAENKFKSDFGGTKPVEPVKTPYTNRYVDNMKDGVAREVKSGDVKLTDDIKVQIKKDAYLQRFEDTPVEWHFYGNPDKAVIQELNKAGIKSIQH